MNYTVFTSHYFTDWILTATTLVSFVISLIYRAHKQLFLIQIYIAASLFIDILFMITELLFPDKRLWHEIDCVSLNLYSILEISLIFLFIKKEINRKSTQYSLKILYGIYISFCLVIWMYFKNAIISNSPHLFALEGIIITAFCLVYFYEFMHSNLTNDIQDNTHFIVICGILFYFSTTVPFYFSSSSLLQISPTFSIIYNCINYCLYTILFLTFIKAYLCPITIQK